MKMVLILWILGRYHYNQDQRTLLIVNKKENPSSQEGVKRKKRDIMKEGVKTNE